MQITLCKITEKLQSAVVKMGDVLQKHEEDFEEMEYIST